MTETPTLNLSFLLHFMTIARPEATLKNKLLLLARLALASSSRGGFRHPIAKFRQLQSRWAFCLQFSFLRMKEHVKNRHAHLRHHFRSILDWHRFVFSARNHLQI